ncbi:MAG: transposase [Planctomycetaceae bacterium]|nr:transposase [Planctomycetaceae bacterium]
MNIENASTFFKNPNLFQILSYTTIDNSSGQPIVIVPDNTRYQHYKLVEGLAKDLGITLQFLPNYSPNLNWMERLWKLVKKKCLDNIYYETFDEFTSVSMIA